MRLPRDWGGEKLARLLGCYGYEVTRQTGSHMRLTTQQNGEHHVTIPRHSPLRIGTLNSILKDVAQHLLIFVLAMEHLALTSSASMWACVPLSMRSSIDLERDELLAELTER